MKSKILGLLAMGLLIGPLAANAVAHTITLQPDGVSGTFDAPAGGGSVTAFDLTFNGVSFTVPSALQYLGPSDLILPNALSGLVLQTGYSGLGSFSALSFANDISTQSRIWRLLSCGPSINGFSCGSITDDGSYRVGSAVPEPGSFALLGFGLAGLGLGRRRKTA